MADPTTTQGAPAAAGTRQPPNGNGSVGDAAQDIFSVLDAEDGSSRRGNAERPVARKTRSEIDDAALASLTEAEDPGAHDDDGQTEDDDEELTQQRDDDAPTDTDAEDDPGDEPDPDSEDDDPEFLQQKVRVKVNGKSMQVTVAEAIKGYQRHGDYSRGTAANAEKERTLDSHLATVTQQRQALDQVLEAQQQVLVHMFGPEPNWDQLQQENPLEYIRAESNWRRRNQQLEELGRMRAQNAAMAQAEIGNRTHMRLQAEAQKMFEKHPDWKDPVKGPKERDRLRGYLAREYGYKPEEIQIGDARHLDIVDKAEKWDALMERVKKRQLSDRRAARQDRAPSDEAPEDEPRRPKPAKPGPAPSTRRVNTKRKEFDAAKHRAARTGKIEDAAGAIAGILD